MRCFCAISVSPSCSVSVLVVAENGSTVEHRFVSTGSRCWLQALCDRIKEICARYRNVADIVVFEKNSLTAAEWKGDDAFGSLGPSHTVTIIDDVYIPHGDKAALEAAARKYLRESA